MEYKRYGFKLPSATSTASNYIEYRMLSVLFGFVLGLLLGNVALIAWGVLFFLAGHIAEVVGKIGLKIGLLFSFVLLMISIFEFFSGSVFWFSSLALALISIGLGLEGIFRKRLLKT